MVRSRRDKPITDKTARKLTRELKRTRRAEQEEARRERMHPAARTEPHDFRQDVTSTQPMAAVHRFPNADGPGPYGKQD